MQEGNIVRINYIGRIQSSGELFDTTQREVAEEEEAVNPNASYGPVPVIVGAEMVVEGLEEALRDMEVGEEKEVRVPPEKAFGMREGDLIKTFSEKKFEDKDTNPYPGMRVSIDGKMGQILSVNSGRVRVDLNHPLAGRTLKYDLEVMEEIEGKRDKVKGVGEFYLGDEPDVELEDDKVKIEVKEGVNESIREELKDKIKEFLDLEVEYEEVESSGSESE